MKKLLITSMAAVAIGLYAKADFTDNESFEGYTNEGPLFQRQTDNEEAYAVTPGWVTDATPEDGIFTVTNIANYVGSGSYGAVSRPTTGIEDSEDPKALAIDTSKPLMRNAVTGDDSQTGYVMTGDESIFFDSVVQFTATESAPTPDSANGDKLMVWLYVSDDVDNDNPGVFGETKPTTNLVITAGYGDDQIATNYLTNLGVVPETWHRLTIKALNDIDTTDNVVPGFEVRLDGVLVSGVLDYQNDEAVSVTTFPSLMKSDASGDNKIIGVAFDGKGAVDDLVFTTTDPFPETLYTITVKIDDEEEETPGAYKQYSVDGGVTYVALDEEKVYTDGDVLEIPQTVTKVMFKIAIPNPDKKLEDEDEPAGEYEDDGYYWIKEVNVADIISNGEGEVVLKVVDNTSTPEVTTYAVTVNSANARVEGLAEKYAADVAVTFVVTANQGYEVVSVMMNTTVLSVNNEGRYSFTMPAEAVTITVTTKAEEVTYPSVGGVDAPEYSNTAKAKIDAAFPGNSYPADGLTVKVNGETLSGAPAVAMLNEAVEMFTLAGDAKFFDADGVLDISFKATGADPDVVAYEAKVGGLAATVNVSSYEVVPKYIDIATNDELQAKPEEGTVTFRLVIQKK